MIEESSPVLSKLTSQQEAPRRGKLHLPPCQLDDMLVKTNTRRSCSFLILRDWNKLVQWKSFDDEDQARLCQEYASHLGLGGGGGGPEDLGGEVLR